MMKYFVFACSLWLSLAYNVQAQKYFTKTGTTEFKASVDAFEPVEAKSESTTAILNTENGDVAALIFIQSFNFRVALMQEHFNENYMDSGTYPKANFKGQIKDFDLSTLTAEPTPYLLKGILTIKGKEQSVETPVNVHIVDNVIMASGNFAVLPQDFDIKIPSIVRKKIAEQINISFNYELNQK